MFKRCPLCSTTWPDARSFIEDPETHLVGYHANFKIPADGLFLFRHQKMGCHTTLGIEIKSLQILYPTANACTLMGTHEACPKYCTSVDNIIACPVSDCVGAQLRQIMQHIRSKIIPEI